MTFHQRLCLGALVVFLGGCTRTEPKAAAQKEAGQVEVYTLAAPLPDLSLVKTPTQEVEFSKVGRFWEKWRLVSVRYREDNGEQRFVYANATAWRAMQERRAVFPDGSMFGKVAFHSEVDPLFPVSREPRGYTRIQLMTKDSRRFAQRGGWGYGIVAPVLPDGAPRGRGNVAESCHACHTLATGRDYVFTSNAFLDRQPPALESYRTRFAERRSEELHPLERQVVEPMMGGAGRVKYYRTVLFAGSVDETLPVLAMLAATDQATFLLSDLVAGHVLATHPLPTCQGGAKITMTANVRRLDGTFSRNIRVGRMCGGHLTWDSSTELH